MMSSVRQQEDIQAKLEGESINEKLSKVLANHAAASASLGATTASRQWSGFKNPRIVRVAHAFGGKDRHSKVCTVRGLRDRRIRLSVPTAIQLYDLQDRLGLSQPSKVIDWLMDATKLDIDKLPPLQFPPGSLAQFHQALMGASCSSHVAPPHFTPMKEGSAHNNISMTLSGKEGININDDLDEGDDEEHEQSIEAKLQIIKRNSQLAVNTAVEGNHYHHRGGSSAQTFFPIRGLSGFLPGLMNNNSNPSLPYSNYCPWDPSNLSLSQFGGHGHLVHSQTDESLPHNNISLAYQQPGVVAAGGTHQLFFCPPPAITTSFFPQHASYAGSSAVEVNDMRQLNRLHELSRSCSLAPPSFNSSQNNLNHPNKGDN